MFKSLKNFQLKHIYDLVQSTGYKNIFNTSIVTTSREMYLSFRCEPKGTFVKSKFHSILIVIENNQITKQVNLSEELYLKGIENVADPKIFSINNIIYLTFNTGSEQPNDLFLLNINDRELEPLRCFFENRKSIEKNWVFFYKNNLLHCVYDLNPLTILCEKKREDKNISFEIVYQSDEIRTGTYSLGSPAVFLKNKLVFIAHRKFYFFRNYRMYLGRLCTLNIDNYNDLVIDDTNLTHSLISLFGSTTKHNKRLISCTYFCGLSKIDSELIVSYGINDVNYNISRLPLTDNFDL